MTMRQFITGHDADGNAIFLSDDEVMPTEVAMIPGYKSFELWSMNGAREVPHSGPFPGVPSYFPDKEGVVFRIIVLPPVADGEAGIEVSQESIDEIQEKLPGFVEHLEPENPGMHTTDSIDFGIVLEGEVYLELDNGAERCVRAGDCVIQNGTRHAWRNRSGKPVTMAFIVLGAERQANPVRS